MDLKKEIKELKKRIEALENRGRTGNKMQEVADFIMSLFEEKDVISVRRIYELGAKRGYKYQTLQIAKRHMLEDQLSVEHREGKGWCWVHDNR